MTSVVVRAEHDHVVVEVSGDLDLATAPQLRDAGLRALGIEPTRVVIDLTDVTFIDSSGLGVLVLLRRKARTHRSELVLVPSDRVDAVLRISGLEHVFTIRRGTAAQQ